LDNDHSWIKFELYNIDDLASIVEEPPHRVLRAAAALVTLVNSLIRGKTESLLTVFVYSLMAVFTKLQTAIAEAMVSSVALFVGNWVSEYNLSNAR
jgi:hypothetical protein